MLLCCEKILLLCTATRSISNTNFLIMKSNLKFSSKQFFLFALAFSFITFSSPMISNARSMKQESKIAAKKLTKEEKKQIKLAQKKAAEKNAKRAAKISGK